jgi:hypothetical protein
LYIPPPSAAIRCHPLLSKIWIIFGCRKSALMGDSLSIPMSPKMSPKRLPKTKKADQTPNLIGSKYREKRISYFQKTTLL